MGHANAFFQSLEKDVCLVKKQVANVGGYCESCCKGLFYQSYDNCKQSKANKGFSVPIFFNIYLMPLIFFIIGLNWEVQETKLARDSNSQLLNRLNFWLQQRLSIRYQWEKVSALTCWHSEKVIPNFPGSGFDRRSGLLRSGSTIMTTMTLYYGDGDIKTLAATFKTSSTLCWNFIQTTKQNQISVQKHTRHLESALLHSHFTKSIFIFLLKLKNFSTFCQS